MTMLNVSDIHHLFGHTHQYRFAPCHGNHFVFLLAHGGGVATPRSDACVNCTCCPDTPRDADGTHHPAAANTSAPLSDNVTSLTWASYVTVPAAVADPCPDSDAKLPAPTAPAAVPSPWPDSDTTLPAPTVPDTRDAACPPTVAAVCHEAGDPAETADARPPKATARDALTAPADAADDWPAAATVLLGATAPPDDGAASPDRAL